MRIKSILISGIIGIFLTLQLMADEDVFTSEEVDFQIKGTYIVLDAFNRYSVGDILASDYYLTGTLSRLDFYSVVSGYELETGVDFYKKGGISLKYSADLSYDEEDKMEDTDWTSTNRARVDIFSVSSLATKWNSFDCYLFYTLLPQQPNRWKETVFKLEFVWGYRKEEWEFEASDTHQEAIDSELNIDVTGPVLNYEISSRGYYSGLIGELKAGIFVLDFGIKYSWKWETENKDYHLLRNKYTYGDLEGTLIESHLGLEIRLWENREHVVSVLLGGIYTKTSSDGSADFLYHGIPYYEQPMETETELKKIFGGFEWRY